MSWHLPSIRLPSPRLLLLCAVVTILSTARLLLGVRGASGDSGSPAPGALGRPRSGGSGAAPYEPARASFARKGDFYLGGLFDVHLERDGACARVSPRGLQWMYAMVYAIERINARQDILPNVTLGFQIKDTCANPNVAVTSSLDFITSSSNFGACDNTSASVDEDSLGSLVAVVGPATSNAAVSVASLFQLFKLPEISYSATSELLSETRYSFFTRVVPSDNHQAAALADVVAHFGWSVVATIYTDDLAYGLAGQERFLQHARERGICVAYESKISSGTTVEDLRRILDELRDFPNVEVIVAFANESPMLRLLEVFAEHNATGYTWIGTDAWTASPALTADPVLARVTQGMLGLRYSTREVAGFLGYLQSLSPLAGTGYRDPFLLEYWEQALACRVHEVSREYRLYSETCAADETLPDSDTFFAGRFVSTIVDAVEVISRALHAALGCDESRCEGKSGADVDREEILAGMKGVSFTGASGYTIEFTEDGNLGSGASYDVFNLKPSNSCASEMIAEKVGVWNHKKGFRIPGNISWNSESPCDAGAIPSSFCSVSCRPGQRRIPKGLSECCWECVACLDGYYSDQEDALTCSNCSSEEIVNTDQTGCLKLPERYFTPTTPIGIAVIILSLPGILLSVAVAAIFVRRRHTQVVVRACAGHSHAILSCALYCFISSWLPFLPANNIACAIKACLQLLPVTLLQGILLITAYVTKKGRRLVRTRTKVLLGAGIVALFCVFNAIWFAVDLPKSSRIPDPEARVLYVDCQDGEVFALALSFLHSVFLDVVGLCTAYRTRANEDNFREGKFVFSAFIVHIMLWVATLGVYLAVGGGRHFQSFILAEGVAFSGYVSLFVLFVPKLYLMKTKPQANETMDAKAKRKIRGKRMAKVKSSKAKLSPEILTARQALLSNCHRALGTARGERGQDVRLLATCSERLEDMKARHRKRLDAKKAQLSDLLKRKVHLIILSPTLPSTSL